MPLDITNHLRAEDKIAERIEALRQNIDELRVAAKATGACSKPESSN